VCTDLTFEQRLSLSMQKEELQRAEYAKSHGVTCVFWRADNGELGFCIYCGKPPDPITAYYLDRQAGGQAALTAHR
jgi:hypothetical protein